MATYNYIAITVAVLIAIAAWGWWRERKYQARWRKWYAANREQIRERNDQ